MRTIVALCVVLSSAVVPARAIAEPKAPALPPAKPLWETELQVGIGMMRRGTNEMATMGKSPLTVTATGSVAFNEEPPAYGFGGLIAEQMGRSSVGVIGGVRLEPNETSLRLRAGGIWMFAPLTLWGAQASVGKCFGKGPVGFCADGQITTYFGGTGLPNDETELQFQLALGMVIRGGR